MSSTFDDAVVGAGILGLAHAFHLARAGRKVVVFERDLRACGASVRNFGMLWPIGQPPGEMHRMALRSRELWLDVLRASGIWHDPVGSLHLAYCGDEAAVLAEYAASSDGHPCQVISPAEVIRRAPAVNPRHLVAGLWSETEVCVDPRRVIAELPAWLAREYGVRFEFGAVVTAYERPRVLAGERAFQAQRLIVCSGIDAETLYPDTYRQFGLVRCKLQMMRSAPRGARLGPMLAAGLTLRHYANFQHCPTLAAVKARVARDHPDYDRYGIHVMTSQNAAGEVVIGDSHEYGEAIEPFDKPEIDRLILDYLATFVELADLQIAARWHGVYAKNPSGRYCVAQPAPGATVVSGVGGAGMTLSFGLAEHVVGNLEN